MKTPEKKPRVSIGLPVYNCEKYVGEAIESVLSQTFKDFELIISDNASADRTEEICREYAAKDSRVRYYRNEKNFGAAKNFNRVFELSYGEYFKWIAADCTIEPKFILKCVDLLDKNPAVVLAFTKYSAYIEFDNTTEVIEGDFDFRSPVTHRRFRKLLKQRFGGKLPIWGLVRSNILKGTHLVRPFIGSDDCLLIELILKGDFGLVPEHLAMVRRHIGSYSDLRIRNDGVEGTAESQWLSPGNKGTFYLPHWRRLWEYSVLVIRSRVALFSKFIMVAFSICPFGLGRLKIMIKELFFAVGLRCLYSYIKQVNERIRETLSFTE